MLAGFGNVFTVNLSRVCACLTREEVYMFIRPKTWCSPTAVSVG